MGPISPMNPMMSDIEEIRKLERAERAYDERRASLKQSSDLRVPPRIFRRYQAPPADTPFAIEYTYNLLGDVRGKDVLELGCGDGENTVLLAHRGARVCGVDVSDRTRRMAAEVRDGQSIQSREVMNYVDQS